MVASCNPSAREVGRVNLRPVIDAFFKNGGWCLKNNTSGFVLAPICKHVGTRFTHRHTHRHTHMKINVKNETAQKILSLY